VEWAEDFSTPLGRRYSFLGGFSGTLQTLTNHVTSTIISTPVGSSFQPGDSFNGNYTSFYPDVSGTYEVQISFNDGCGDDYITIKSFNVPCPTFIQEIWTVSAITPLTFTDQQTVRLEAFNTLPAHGYTTDSYDYSWTVVSAPDTSVYAPSNTLALLSVNTSFGNDTEWPTTNISVNTRTTVTTKLYKRVIRSVVLDPVSDQSQSVYSTCFRPDIGGDYVVKLSFQLRDTTCVSSQTTTVKVNCGVAPVLTGITDQTVLVDRIKPTRVWLNATSVTDADTPKSDLIYNWKVLYPVQDILDDDENVIITAPIIHAPHSMVSSFWVPQSNVKYIIELSVSDHCNVQTKNFTIFTPCSVTLPLENRTLATTYDGVVPVQLMSFGYDQTYEISGYLSTPKCQTYNWILYDYSTSYSDSLLVSDGTAFTKTPGFAGLISVVVIVAVVVPIVLWMYFTKKACFKNSGSTSGGV